MLDPSRLDGIVLFADLKPAALRELTSRGRLTRLAPGETLWRAGSEPRGLYVLLSGRVRVTGEGSGRPHRVHVAGPGDTLGEVPLFDGGRYPATAEAASAVECAVFTRGALRAAMAADSELAFRLLENLGSRVRGLVERLDALVGLDVRQRLAAYLLERREGSANQLVALRGSQRELAEELGTVREVVVRALRQLEDAGAIARESHEIRIVDAAMLESLSR